MSETNFSRAVGTGAQGEPVLAVILVAAGSGTRLGAGIPKAAVKVGPFTLLEWSLRRVQATGLAARLVVTLPPGDRELRSICSSYGALAVEGGASRAESVAAALGALEEAPPQPGFSGAQPDSVLVHDVARCFTPAEVFYRVVAALGQGQKVVIPVLPVADTIKTVDGEGYVTGTPARADLRAVQTPQGFDLPTLVEAHRQLEQLPAQTAETITDDAMLAETLGIAVATVAGHAESFKITTPLDYALAQTLFGEKKESKE